MPCFPRWLGYNSSTNKHYRDINHLLLRSKNVINTSGTSYRLDYLPYLRKHLLKPLENQDINKGIEYLDEYGYDCIDLLEIMNEFTFNKKDYTERIDKNIKKNFKKQFSKGNHTKSQSFIHDIEETLTFKPIKKSKKLSKKTKVVLEDIEED